ncbi:hypothetical protein PM082_000204 [Marasmius tenuissimus]|nr:hypothetical protein PM082_000204 [Marasmius tenuissimus]
MKRSMFASNAKNGYNYSGLLWDCFSHAGLRSVPLRRLARDKLRNLLYADIRAVDNRSQLIIGYSSLELSSQLFLKQT